MMFPPAGVAAPHVKSGRLKALAITTLRPSALFPGLPTVAASGIPGFEAGNMNGMFAPAKTPAAIVNRLSQETGRLLNRPDVKEKFLTAGEGCHRPYLSDLIARGEAIVFDVSKNGFAAGVALFSILLMDFSTTQVITMWKLSVALCCVRPTLFVNRMATTTRAPTITNSDRRRGLRPPLWPPDDPPWKSKPCQRPRRFPPWLSDICVRSFPCEPLRYIFPGVSLKTTRSPILV